MFSNISVLIGKALFATDPAGCHRFEYFVILGHLLLQRGRCLAQPLHVLID